MKKLFSEVVKNILNSKIDYEYIEIMIEYKNIKYAIYSDIVENYNKLPRKRILIMTYEYDREGNIIYRNDNINIYNFIVINPDDEVDVISELKQY
jgi:hypothetical protein